MTTKGIRVTTLAFSAILALFSLTASASAETTLLAEWLINGEKFGASMPIQLTGGFSLSDIATSVSMKCSGIFVGTVGPSGEGELTLFLSLGGVEITLAAPLKCEPLTGCEAAADIEAVIEELPWTSLMFLMADLNFLNLIRKAGYTMRCLVIGVLVEDTCTLADGEYLVENGTEGVENVNTVSPAANCSVGGSQTGNIIWEAGSHIFLTEGGLLSRSSE